MRIISSGRNEGPSYYLRPLTSQGERTLWGKDLERAVREGATRPKSGDLVGARRISRGAVTVTSRQRDAEGRVVAQQEQLAHRTHWVVEKVSFFAEPARLARRLRDEQTDVRESVRAHPELRSAFLSVRVAEVFATQRIENPKDRARFLELLRGVMAGSVQKGSRCLRWDCATYLHVKRRRGSLQIPSARTLRGERPDSSGSFA